MIDLLGRMHGKMRRIHDLYDHPRTDDRMICVDEFGPLSSPTPAQQGGQVCLTLAA
jgi:hypothetical protein